MSTSCLSAQLDVFEAAERYQKEGTPLIILAGKDYGSGNSRDWVAKGPYLLVNCSTHSALWTNQAKWEPKRQSEAATFLPGFSAHPLLSSTGRPCGHRRELWEAPQEPAGGNGYHAASVPSPAEHRLPGAQREGEVQHRHARQPESQAAAHRQGMKPAANPEFLQHKPLRLWNYGKSLNTFPPQNTPWMSEIRQ